MFFMKQRDLKLRDTYHAIEDLVRELSERHLFAKDLRSFHHNNINDLEKYDDKRDLQNFDFKNDALSSSKHSSSTMFKKERAYRLRALADLYDRGLSSIVLAYFKRNIEPSKWRLLPKVMKH